MSQALGVIGCGKMAFALLQGMSKTATFAPIYISDPSQERLDLFQKEFGALPLSNEALIEKADMIILAVKPPQVKDVLKQTQTKWNPSKLLVSIAAGIRIEDLQAGVGNAIPILRVMPNTPCLVGEGVSVIAGGGFANAEHLEMGQKIFAPLGLAMIMEENYLDAVTAVSGSGPAYVFLMVEAMMQAAVQVGLSTEIARPLVLQTFKGAISMLESSDVHPAVFKEQVCSPGGTTIAAVRKLEENGIRKAFFEAVEKAYLRSIEMGRS